MARPRKLNADYYPHDGNLRHHRHIQTLERKYGIAGYGTYCKLKKILLLMKKKTLILQPPNFRGAPLPHFQLRISGMKLR